jgi:DNA-binding transcriptional LysR family regulator
VDLKIQEVILETAHLRHFVQIVDRGSIVGAAQHLGLSRSVLRRSLSTLEEEVGVPLLHRDALGVRLTAAGAVVLEHGRLMLEGERALLTDARAAETDVVGVLRVIQPVGLPLAMHVKILLATHQTLPRQRLVVRHVEDPASCLHDVEPLVPVLEDQVGEELTFRVTTPFASRADARTRSTLQLLHQHLEALPLD